MREVIVKTVPCERGTVFGIIDGRRIRLADCEPTIEIIEKSVPVSAIGAANGARIKDWTVVIGFSERQDIREEFTISYLAKVRSYELSVRIQRQDGKFREFYFRDLITDGIDLKGKWEFEIPVSDEELRELRNI